VCACVCVCAHVQPCPSFTEWKNVVTNVRSRQTYTHKCATNAIMPTPFMQFSKYLSGLVSFDRQAPSDTHTHTDVYVCVHMGVHVHIYHRCVCVCAYVCVPLCVSDCVCLLKLTKAYQHVYRWGVVGVAGVPG
jgi:hypothetical protein